MRKISGYLLVLVIATSLLGTSCKYQKLLKSSDSDLKFDKAKQYYEDGDYAKAMTIFEQLIPIFRGTDKGEEVSYLFAYCNYYVKDYILAGHYFRRFAGSFPNSEHAEESSFMSAYCYYLDAPKPSLDQETTRKAIQEFQLYISRYPKSERIQECNDLVDELRRRLEKKSYDNAMLYYRVEQYKAAVVSLKSSLKEFPDTDYREDILYYIIKSNYKYALMSIYGKTKERLEDTLRDYKVFIKTYPNSKYNKDVAKIYVDVTDKLKYMN
ncbi:MAG: outer membrane protein assembly factor BamD [Bacteroidales bacterium]|nr:outer membrane protein assembly factor BamD [Bacteroidales bacterium]